MIINLLRLIRIPNSFSAVSNIWTGYILISAGASLDWLTVSLGALASALIYSGGVALNDYADRQSDAQEHPGRLIPQGKISPHNALAISFVCLLSGLLISLYFNIGISLIALTLCLTVVAYDFILKRHWLFGGLGMGICRGLNCLFGLSLAGATVSSPHWGLNQPIFDGLGAIKPSLLTYPLTMAVYIFALTLLARSETKNPLIEKIVKAGLFGIIIIDALFLYICGPFWWPMAVLLCLLIPMYLLGKIFRMT